MRFVLLALACAALAGCMVEPAHLELRPDNPQHQAARPYDAPHSYCWYNHC